MLDLSDVQKAQGHIELLAGNGNPGLSGDGQDASAAMFNQPYCTSLSPNGRRLLIADLRNQRLRAINLQTNRVTTIAGNGKSGKTIEEAKATQTPLAGPRAACACLSWIQKTTAYAALIQGQERFHLQRVSLGNLVPQLEIPGRQQTCSDHME
jgi:hypothetical protein